MAIRTATISATIEEPNGNVVTESITLDYDDDDNFTWTDIDFDYLSSESAGGPVMRPRRPR